MTKDSEITLVTKTPSESGRVGPLPCTELQAFSVEQLVNWLNSDPTKLEDGPRKRWAQAVQRLQEEAKMWRDATENVSEHSK